MAILLELFYKFLIVGLFSFGGAYSAIPLIKDAVSSYEYITGEMIADFIAVSESTPGPIAINLATFVGTEVCGIKGAIFATLAVILPAFIIIIIFVISLDKFIRNRNVQFALSIIRPCVIGMIMSVGIYMLYEIVYKSNIINDVIVIKDMAKSFIIALLLIIIIIIDKVYIKKLNTIHIILLSAIFGIAINCIL